MGIVAGWWMAFLFSSFFGVLILPCGFFLYTSCMLFDGLWVSFILF